jgi:hypothetical protein
MDDRSLACLRSKNGSTTADDGGQSKDRPSALDDETRRRNQGTAPEQQSVASSALPVEPDHDLAEPPSRIEGVAGIRVGGRHLEDGRTAVNRAIDALVGIVVAAPSDGRTRDHWLERLWEVNQADQIPYIETVPTEKSIRAKSKPMR